MKPEKYLDRYIRLLEKQLAQLRADLKTLRQDLEFYRGKVERLELAIASSSPIPAQAEYAARSERKPPALSSAELSKIIGTHLPFRELARKWNTLSAEDQDKAVKDGWTVEEEDNAGRS